MTRLCVSIMVESADQALAAAAQAAERGADMVEYRIDTFIDDHEAIERLVGASPLPCIVTCRHVDEGGGFDGPPLKRIAALRTAAGCQPAYIDVELAHYQRDPQLREEIKAMVDHPGQSVPTSTGLILSTHDFDHRPADLFQRIEAMISASACRVMKTAWHARSLRDNVQAFELIADQHKPTIALCMGRFGLPSRVLAAKFGALLAFCGPDDASVTAPGQLGAATMKRLYRWDRINADTAVYGVIGWPVEHSMSPAIHNAGFDAVDYNGVYLPMAIPPEYEHFKATVGEWLDHAPLDFRGASVTIPHKENLLRFITERGGEIEPLTRAIGAANTLTRREDGSLYASNSDYTAALGAVCDAIGCTPADMKGRRIAVIGAGGAARALVAAFAHHGATLVVYNRTLQKAQRLADPFTGPHDAKVVAAPLDNLPKSCCEVYINCTPVGMHPQVDATPVPDPPECWGDGTVVFDTIYNPVQTRLLRQAERAGCRTISGVEMFTRQAAAQFELWTGRHAPAECFEQVMAQHLGA
jgi:3-dehydroquinate dehydratase/shikimate dehydrogenase